METSLPTIASKISQILAQEIIAGSIVPGQKLEEPTLAERFQVSRTPIREALRLLDARGLIELIPRRGGVVTNVDAAQLSDMLEGMCELESLCCRVSTERMSAVQRRQLELLHEQAGASIENKDEAGYLALNRSFHQLIVQGSQNQTLIGAVESLRERLAPFRAAQAGVERRFETSHREHQRIVDAVLEGSPEKAYAAMRSHTTRLTIHLLERLGLNPQ